MGEDFVMLQLISPENRERIKVEILALGGGARLDESIAELEFAAQRFFQKEMERVAKSRPDYNPETLLFQIQKVWSLKGQQREEAFKKAVRMGLKPGTPSRLRRPFVEYASYLEMQVADSYNYPEKFSTLTNRRSESKQILMASCLVVWMQAGGEVRFAVPIDRKSASLRQDGGPLGRFLTAAQVDAHCAASAAQKEAGLKTPVLMPSYQGLRSLALKMWPLAEMLLESSRGGINDGEGPLEELDAPTDFLD
jgi:hypothetical protein